MPLELLATGPGSAAVREYDESTVGPTDVRVESEFSAFKHGTGLRTYRADGRDYDAPFDWEARLHREGDSRAQEYPAPLGNATVGFVTDVGDDVDRFDPGDRVYGHLPIRETHTVSADDLRPVPHEMPVEALAYADPARVALHVVRTGEVSVGDTVAVFGAGAIGQMTAQIARLAGARRVAVSEPVERRREAARDHGADLLVDPVASDAAELLKAEFRSGGEPGVDVALETSGAYPGLNDAVRSTAFGGVVASCGFYEGEPKGFSLTGEFHRNRLEIRTVRPPSEPLRDAPRWDYDRLDEEAFALVRDGRLSADGLVDPVVPIEEAADGLRFVDERPEESIKLGVSYD